MNDEESCCSLFHSDCVSFIKGLYGMTHLYKFIGKLVKIIYFLKKQLIMERLKVIFHFPILHLYFIL